MDHGFTTRQASDTDLDAIVAFNQALFREDAGQRDPWMNLDWPAEEGHAYFAKHLSSQESGAFLALDGDQPVGYLIGYVGGGSTLRPVPLAELESMYVEEAYRGRGVGRALVERFFAWARERGAERASVTAYAANERAIAFYRRFGFEPRSLSMEVGLGR